MNNSPNPNPTPSVTEDMHGPERLYLAPRCCEAPNEGRLWCEDDVWHGECEDGNQGIEYVRADLVKSAAPQHTGQQDDVLDTIDPAWADAGQAQQTGLTDVARAREAYIAVCDKDDAPPDFKASIRRGDRDNTLAIQVATAAIAAAQHPVHADVKRLLREARSYVEQAGLRHHDVSGLLAEIDAALLVSNRSGVERLRAIVSKIAERKTTREALTGIVGEAHLPAQDASDQDKFILEARAALDIPTINEGEDK